MVGTSRALAAVMASVLFVGPVLAQPTPTPAEKQQAKALVKKAIAKSQAGDHGRAIELYLEAYEIVPMPTILSNVGTEYQADGKPAEALEYFCKYLMKDPSGPLQAYAKTQARQIQDELGQEDLEVCEEPPKPKPKQPAPPEPPDETGTGTGTGTTEPPPAEDPPEKAPEQPGSGLKITGLVTAGLGLAAIGGGLYFGNRAKTISNDISTWPMTMPWRDDIADYEAEGARAEKLQIVGLAAGGVLVVTGTILFVVGRSKKPAAKEQLTVSPVVSPSSAGMVFAGSF